MKEIYKIRFVKRVPIAEAEGRTWLFDTGCPISSPNYTPHPAVGEFLGIQDLRIMGTDGLFNYVLIDYRESRFLDEGRSFTFLHRACRML